MQNSEGFVPASSPEHIGLQLQALLNKSRILPFGGTSRALFDHAGVLTARVYCVIYG